MSSSPAEAPSSSCIRAGGIRASKPPRSRSWLVLTLAAALLPAACSWRPPPRALPPPMPAPAPTPAPAAPELGSVSGQLLGPRRGAAERQPVVVYLAARTPLRRGAAEHRATRTLSMRPEAFAPRLFVIAVRQRVRFRNDDQIYHRLFSASEARTFDLGSLAAGESKTLRFERPGVVRFYCALHEHETGLVFVAPSHLHATVDDAGSFEIDGVPPGGYELRIWSEGQPPLSHPVTVRSGRATAVEIAVEGKRRHPAESS